MAPGNDGAPAEEGTSQCGVAGSSPKPDEPNPCCPTVPAESDPCEGSSGAAVGFRTYKRRKLLEKSSSATRSGQEGTPNTDGTVQLETQTSKELQDRASEGTVFEEVHASTLASHGAADDLSDSTHGQWCKVVLEQINHSLSEGGGLAGCIKKAIQHSLDINSTKIKEPVFMSDGRPGHAAQAGWMCNGFAAKGAGCTLNGSSDEFNQDSMNETCLRAFYNVIISGKFNLLCKLLSENFQGSKIDRLLDFGLIDSRMKEGIYKHSPARFSSDFEQVWRKLEGIGIQWLSLAKGLADLSRIPCHEHVHAQDPQRDTKLEQAGDWSVFKDCTCRRCGERAHGRECLICDSCEDMYHVSCIEPAVEEIPPRNWYCTQCISYGKRPTHENCVVCERLCSLKTDFTSVGEKIALSNREKDLACSNDDDSSKPLQNSLGLCNTCGSDMFEDEIIRECGHSLCPHGNYHERCLTAKQLKSYASYWYCPSCLCQACLSDQDDDKIVLCDACDQAYHIYCVKPPLSKIPVGKWFCSKCEAGIQAILRVKRACEGVKVKGKRGRKKIKDRVVHRGKGKRIKEEAGEGSSKGGGMDMLLNAAKTLNFEENLAAVRIKG
ncbi:hypothetical protein CRG98_033299 [Punica granatum]|uniref:PHD finger protein EHD3 n=1 Tax=Punica granatum TaxID=22663 RepID=A0A2I0IRH4_PUNGR|nr:hypothetical protein CRG98_033299 [Punica granatum]